MPEDLEFKYIPRKVNFEMKDYIIIKLYAQEKGLGEKGLSAANRMIIREWAQLTNFVESLKTVPTHKKQA